MGSTHPPQPGGDHNEDDVGDDHDDDDDDFNQDNPPIHHEGEGVPGSPFVFGHLMRFVNIFSGTFLAGGRLLALTSSDTWSIVINKYPRDCYCDLY